MKTLLIKIRAWACRNENFCHTMLGIVGGLIGWGLEVYAKASHYYVIIIVGLMAVVVWELAQFDVMGNRYNFRDGAKDIAFGEFGILIVCLQAYWYYNFLM